MGLGRDGDDPGADAGYEKDMIVRFSVQHRLITSENSTSTWRVQVASIVASVHDIARQEERKFPSIPSTLKMRR